MEKINYAPRTKVHAGSILQPKPRGKIRVQVLRQGRVHHDKSIQAHYPDLSRSGQSNSQPTNYIEATTTAETGQTAQLNWMLELRRRSSQKSAPKDIKRSSVSGCWPNQTQPDPPLFLQKN